MALGYLHSSFRERERGFGGLIGDLRIAEWVLSVSTECTPEFQAGVRSIVSECQIAIRSFERD